MNNNHPHGEHISAYLDGMLDVARTHEVALHMCVCPACRASLEALQATKALLHGMDAPSAPSAEFWANTYRRMRVEGETQSFPWLSLQGSWKAAFQRSQRRWAAGAVAVALVGAAAVSPLLVRSPVHSNEAVGAYDSIDVSSLVQAHTAAASRQPLADPDRQAMISADADNGFSTDDSSPEAAVHADASP